MLRLIEEADVFDAGDGVVVEHDAGTHQLRVVGSTTFDRASRSSGTEHYEVLLRTRADA